jgi:lipopolysaccharide export system protein LptC
MSQNYDPFIDDENAQPTAGLTNLVRDRDDAAATVAQSRRHTSIVRRLKLILPLIAVGLVVVMLAWTDMGGTIEPVRKEDVAPQTVGRNELLNPKFQSEDAKQQPYTITADRAFQESKDMDMVILDKPVADLSLKNGAWIAMEAKDGEYVQSSQKLKLKGDVKVFHDSGYELSTDEVDLDVQGQTANTTHHVSGHGPSGTIEGTGMQANGKDGVIIFTGPARMTIINTKQPTP